MKYILMVYYLLMKCLYIDEFLESDWDGWLLITELSAEFIVAMMVIVEGEKISDGDGTIEIILGESKYDVGCDSGARADYKQTHQVTIRYILLS